MTTIAEYQKQPVSEQLARMRRTPDELADAIRGRSDAELSRRPDEKNWSAVPAAPAGVQRRGGEG
jgi:hypothetical protein